MALGSLLLGKRYTIWDHASALLLCLGLIGFTLSKNADDADHSLEASTVSASGIALLLFAVCCDAVQVLLQEKLLRDEQHYTPMHVMAQTNGLGFLAVVASITCTSSKIDASTEVVPILALPFTQLFLYGMTSWFGVACFLALARSYGGTAAVVAANSRKFFSIVLSFIIFPKPCSFAQIMSGMCVIVGVIIHIHRKYFAHVSQLDAVRLVKKSI